MTYLAFALGLTAGACIGVVVAAMAFVSKQEDEK